MRATSLLRRAAWLWPRRSHCDGSSLPAHPLEWHRGAVRRDSLRSGVLVLNMTGMLWMNVHVRRTSCRVFVSPTNTSPQSDRESRRCDSRPSERDAERGRSNSSRSLPLPFARVSNAYRYRCIRWRKTAGYSCTIGRLTKRAVRRRPAVSEQCMPYGERLVAATPGK